MQSPIVQMVIELKSRKQCGEEEDEWEEVGISMSVIASKKRAAP